MIFLHGLDSSSHTYKASVIRNSFPELIVRDIARKVFTNLTYEIVDDNHRLHIATDTLDWKTILE